MSKTSIQYFCFSFITPSQRSLSLKLYFSLSQKPCWSFQDTVPQVKCYNHLFIASWDIEQLCSIHGWWVFCDCLKALRLVLVLKEDFSINPESQVWKGSSGVPVTCHWFDYVHLLSMVCFCFLFFVVARWAKSQSSWKGSTQFRQFQEFEE